MTLREDLLPIADSVRAIAGPSGVDIRTAQLTIRTRTWSGGRAGVGATSDVDLVIPKNYKVRFLTGKEIAASGGRYEVNDLRVGPITPNYSGGGFSIAQLAPDGADGVEILYVLSGVFTGEYARVTINTDRPFRYELVLRRRRRTP